MQQKIVPIAVAVIAIAALGALLYFSGGPAEEGQQALPDVVARVNGEDIEKKDLEETEVQLAAGQGVADLATLNEEQRGQLQTQALDILVSQELVRQAAEGAGITATDDDVESMLDTIKARFENDEQYQEELAKEGVTESELREQLESSFLTDAYLNQKIDAESVVVTEAEIQAQYEQAVAGQENAPPLAEIRDQIESLLLQQKRQAAVSEVVDLLRADAEIEILI